MTRRILYIFATLLLILGVVGILYLYRAYSTYQAIQEEQAAQTAAIESVIASRLASNTSTDPFGDDDIAKILLIGLDTRAGSDVSHCDAIQLITIDRAAPAITITAVPRGTYANLPPGTGVTSSDYYVSNSCALGDLDYGIQQIERILGTETDYVAFIGFSELVGALRTLRLPTSETVQWLRHRQGYGIGEPQRAHNHSTFIKQMMVRYSPESITPVNRQFFYLLYTFVDTDLTFDQGLDIVQVLSDAQVHENPDMITLQMRPAYDVQDIAYDEHTAGTYVTSMVSPIAKYLGEENYTDLSTDDISAQVQTLIDEKGDDPAFIDWAWNHTLWNQVYDTDTRLELHYELLTKQLDNINGPADRQAILGDYVLEMEFLGHNVWAEKGRELIAAEVTL